MKRIIVILLIIGLVLTSLTGCGSQQISEEERKAELKARMETETDIKNKNTLYQYVKKEIKDITSERFDQWNIYYFDITGNGTEEAVLVDTYGADWHNKVEVITKDNGQFERIPSEIFVGKYGTTPDFKDGFLAVTLKIGGSGEHTEQLDLFVYNGSKMVQVLNQLMIFNSVGFPGDVFNETGKIDGKLTDFTYTVTKHDQQTNKITTEAKQQYTYNPNDKKFEIKTLGTQTAKNETQGSIQPAINPEKANVDLLNNYERNKKYQVDLNGQGYLTTVEFVHNGTVAELNVGSAKFDFVKNGILPELTLSKFKILDGKFLFSEADPPQENNLYIFYYNGSQIRQIAKIPGAFEDIDNKIQIAQGESIRVERDSNIMEEGKYQIIWRYSTNSKTYQPENPNKMYAYAAPIDSKANTTLTIYESQSKDSTTHQVPSGTAFTVLAENGSWLLIQVDNRQWWLDTSGFRKHFPTEEKPYEIDGMAFLS